VAKPTVRANIHQSLDVQGHFTPQVTLDCMATVDDLTDTSNLVLGEILYTCIGIDLRLRQDLPGRCWANSIDIVKGHLYTLCPWEIDACDASHGTPLSLLLLMFRRRADHHHDSPPTNDLTLFATLFD